jgi:RNA polymerase sigma factor (sigma-70 family)
MSYSRLPADVFSELLRPHLPALYRLAFRFTGRQCEAEDLLQELLTRLYARSERLTEVESLRPWLARALYNLHVDQHRQQARTPLAYLQQPAADSGDADDYPAQRDHNADPAAAVEMELLRQGIAEVLAQLPGEQQEVVILHDMEGYELRETAAILGVALGTVKSRLHRAHGRLRGPLRQRNLIPSNVVLRDDPSGSDAGMPSFRMTDDED